METQEEQPPPLVPKKAKWPKVIAIIAIVLGSLNLLSALSSPVLNKLQSGNFDAIEAAGIELREGFVDEYDSMIFSQSISSSCLAAFLLVGGILLLKKKPVSPLLLKIWAGLQIVIGLFVTFKFQGINREFLEATTKASFSSMGPDGDAMAENIVKISYMFGLVVGIFFLLALPVFLLIWFSRDKVKSEVARWS